MSPANAEVEANVLAGFGRVRAERILQVAWLAACCVRFSQEADTQTSGRTVVIRAVGADWLRTRLHAAYESAAHAACARAVAGIGNGQRRTLGDDGLARTEREAFKTYADIVCVWALASVCIAWV